jgi:K+-sensing histidine kinase KdpD
MWPAAGGKRTICRIVLVDAETPRSYFVTTQIGVLMGGFLAGLITGSLIGVVVTLLALMIVSGVKGPESTSEGQVPNRKVFLAALVPLAVCGVCFTLDLEKSALLALLLSVLLIAKLGGSKRGIAAAGIAAVLLAWFLPPNGSLTVSGLDNRLALALFILGTVVGSIVVEGNQWLKRWITTSDPDR